MKYLKFIVMLLCEIVLFSCDMAPIPSASSEIEHAQQEGSEKALLQNQPVPVLTYSMERKILTEIYLARNRKVATWTYMRDMNGRITEICPSIGYPIPYATQLTNSLQIAVAHTPNPGPHDNWSEGVIGNPEPSGLYPPSSANGTWVGCTDKDGLLNPGYFEDNLFAMPYRIKSDFKLQRVDDSSSFAIKLP